MSNIELTIKRWKDSIRFPSTYNHNLTMCFSTCRVSAYGDTLYTYSTPLAVKLHNIDETMVLINCGKYTVTTSKHQHIAGYILNDIIYRHEDFGLLDLLGIDPKFYIFLDNWQYMDNQRDHLF